MCLKIYILSDQLVWQVDVKHWAGWTAYTIFIFGTFLTLKIINYRLHRALGIDQVVEEEEEEEHGSEDEEKVCETGKAATSEDAKKEEEAEAERKELGLDGQVVDTTAQTKALEAGFTLPGQTLDIEKSAEQKGNETEESLQHHRDSASTLGYSSNHQSTPEETTELRALAVGGEEGEETAKPLLVAVDLEGEGDEGDEEKEEEEEEGGRKDDEGLDQADSSGSTLRADKESSSSEGEYHTPPVLSFTPSSSTEPGLKPIHEEPLSSQPTNEKWVP